MATTLRNDIYQGLAERKVQAQEVQPELPDATQPATPQPAPNSAQLEIKPITNKVIEVTPPKPAATASAVPPPPAKAKDGFYTQTYRQMFGDVQPESEQDKAKRLKREKSRETIANLSDALANVANIWGTIKGADPIKLSSLSEANRKRYEYALNHRKQNDDVYRRGLMQAMQSDIQDSKQQARHEATQAQQQREYERKLNKDAADAEFKRRDWLYHADRNAAKDKLDADKFSHQKEQDKIRARISQQNANTAAQRVRALEARTSGTGAGKMTEFAMSDGSVVSIPKSLEKDYYADVYDAIARVVNEPEYKNNPDVKRVIDAGMMVYDSMGMVSRSSQQRDAVHALAKQIPEVEQYMKERAKQYNARPTTEYPNNDELEINQEADEIDELLNDLIPNM